MNETTNLLSLEALDTVALIQVKRYSRSALGVCARQVRHPKCPYVLWAAHLPN